MPIRISWSLLNAYLKGDIEGMCNTYLHTNEIMTPAMRRGIAFDSLVREQVTEHGGMPEELGNIPLIAPEAGVYFNIPYSDDVTLSGEFDVFDYGDNTIYEIKCSTAQDAGQWMNSGQMSFYLLAATMMYKQVSGLWVLRYDPVAETYDTSVTYAIKRRADEAKQMVDENAGNIIATLKEQGVI